MLRVEAEAQEMDLFSLDDEVAACEAALNASSGVSRLHELVRLAWHLRQRDTRRAVALADEARTAISELTADGQGAEGELARLALVQGEAKWLFAEFDAASAFADEALRSFMHRNDAVGVCDAHWLRAWIAADRGQIPQRDAELQAATQAARSAADELRLYVTESALAGWEVVRDLAGAKAKWGSRFTPPNAGHPLFESWGNHFLTAAAFKASDFGVAAGFLMPMHEAALASGQIQRAIVTATNIGSAFGNLNDNDAAFEWMQRALQLARPTGWPASVGMCLMQTAEALRALGRLDAAQELLSEAIETLARLPASRINAAALSYYADLALDRADHDGALDAFRRLAERATALNQSDFPTAAKRGQAQALAGLGRPHEALAEAAAALDMARAQKDPYHEIAALKVLAAIHSTGELPPPAGMTALSAPLHYYEQLMAVAADIAGYTLSAQLLQSVAAEYAKAGQHQRAYELSLQAIAAQAKVRSQEATNRAIAMQVRHQTERARADSEHHRQLAASEARRAALLQQTSTTLERLSAVGQEITAHLDAAAVLNALDRHMQALLGATRLSVYLLDSSQRKLECVFTAETAARASIDVDDAHDELAWCVRGLKEIQVDAALELPPAAADVGHDAPRPASAIFAPLLVGERVLGAISIRSPDSRGYAERERLIFRTLCAYGAIAMDNATAYRQLEATLKALSQTQAQLVRKNVELERAYRALEEISLTDPLTGLRNRRFLVQQMEADTAILLRHYDEHKRGSARAINDADLVFFMVDLDDFKRINDRFGHAAGDSVLLHIRERLQEVFRQSDYLIRWGGEEFLAIARSASRLEADLMAERIRAAVAQRPFELPEGQRISMTASVGFACFPFMVSHPRLLHWSKVVEVADQALYIAKRSGRNAWVGLAATELTEPQTLHQLVMRDVRQAAGSGQMALTTNVKSLLAAPLEPVHH